MGKNDQQIQEGIINGAIESQPAHKQAFVIQVHGECKGKPFSLLFDTGSSHSFISHDCVKNLELCP